MGNAGIIFDKQSARRLDENGFLHVEGCKISKECVNPYLGKEIPDSESMGLQPDKVYQIYRPGEALAAAAASSNMIPLMDAHIEIDAMKLDDEEIAKHRVGSTGQSAKFKAPYLINDLVITNAAAIAAVDSKEQRELSCAYRYKIIMESGEFEGTKYDGYMQNINFNHVALVEEGRAGPEVMVADDSSKLKEARVERIDRIKQAMTPGPWAKIRRAMDGCAAPIIHDEPDPIDIFVNHLTKVKAAITKQLKPGASEEDGKALDDCTSAIDLAVHHLLDVKEDDDEVGEDSNPEGVNQYTSGGRVSGKNATRIAVKESGKATALVNSKDPLKLGKAHSNAAMAHHEAAKINRKEGNTDHADKHEAMAKQHEREAKPLLNSAFNIGRSAHDRSVTQDISKREDVSPKRGQSEYGNVKFADPKNKKYPIDTPAHVRAAASYFGMAKNRSKYSQEEQDTIQRNINAAEKQFKLGAHAEGK